RCTASRSTSCLISASSTRRTTFFSADHRCSRHLFRSPEMECFACDRSNVPAPSSSTTASRAWARKSSTRRMRASGVSHAVFQPAKLTSVTSDHPQLRGSHPRLFKRRTRNPVWDNESTRWELFPTEDHLIIVDKNRFFFDHYGLTERDLEHYLAAALSAGGDYADLYFEYLSSTSLMVDESMVKSASQGISAGCGIRVISGERTGYAYTDDLSPERILHAARTAALIASAPAKTPVAGFQQTAARSLYPVTLPSVDAEITAKVELVMRADKSARAYDPRIQEVRASYGDELRNILVVGS